MPLRRLRPRTRQKRGHVPDQTRSPGLVHVFSYRSVIEVTNRGSSSRSYGFSFSDEDTTQVLRFSGFGGDASRFGISLRSKLVACRWTRSCTARIEPKRVHCCFLSLSVLRRSGGRRRGTAPGLAGRWRRICTLSSHDSRWGQEIAVGGH